METRKIETAIEDSNFWIFGIRSLGQDEDVAVGQVMPESHIWRDGTRTNKRIGGTCCFVVREMRTTWAVEDALKNASSYKMSGKYALLGGKQTGNNDLIEEPNTVAIANAVVLLVWENK